MKRKGLVKEYEKNVPLPQSQLHTARYAHHIWQVDGQGATTVQGIGKVHLININRFILQNLLWKCPYYAGLHSGAP